MSAGVYQIRNLSTGRVYVGSSVDMQSRWEQHRGALRRGTHHSVSLQTEWRDFGEQAFVFELIVAVNSCAALIDLEQHWIDALQAANFHQGYNVCPTAGSMLGYRHSAESIARMAEAKVGQKLSIEHKKNIGVSALGNRSRSGQKQGADEKQKRSMSLKAFWTGKSRETSPAACEKMRLAKLGTKQSQATVEKRLATIRLRKTEEYKEKSL